MSVALTEFTQAVAINVVSECFVFGMAITEEQVLKTFNREIMFMYFAGYDWHETATAIAIVMERTASGEVAKEVGKGAH